MEGKGQSAFRVRSLHLDPESRGKKASVKNVVGHGVRSITAEEELIGGRGEGRGCGKARGGGNKGLKLVGSDRNRR